jgi:hypothetical protein
MIYELPVKGQGVFIFTITQDAKGSTFRLTTKDKTDGLIVEFTKDRIWVTEIKSLKPLLDKTNTEGISTHSGAYYWFSIDAQNQRLYAGIGEARLETVIYRYTYQTTTKTEYDTVKQFLESITQIQTDDVTTTQKMRIVKDPVRLRIPLSVKNTDELTMDAIASGNYMPKANLSRVGQKLYDCISGKAFTLNTPEFPDFTQAIEYSIRTPGLWCYKKLREKSREFNPDKPDLSETYLRITLGENNGESPGIPYVMEIWPVGHYSPIHSHANATAIIRVLNGEINVSLYAFLCEGIKPFGVSTFKENDVTWISPTLNQTHQLKNMETNTYTCITIQCYMYNAKDDSHYDYFDYLDADGGTQQYEPDSDMDFLEFKKKIKEEWDARTKSVEVVKSKRWWWPLGSS